jgi:hypothetical protein
MPQVGFESTTPAFERAKTVHALDREATMTGLLPSGLHFLEFLIVFVRAVCPAHLIPLNCLL